ncbi:hypothetical protein PG991_006749 [Apiospora marii]|uniref:Uncharacterized protein n=1 Tax=Apiospora marii TaxID=335849 RepID=A0ABR1RYN6_9PEZI
MRLVGTRPYLTTETPFYMSSVPFVILLLLLSVAALVESASVCPFEGGWSLRVDANNCPVVAPINCGKGLQQRCCPPGLACAGKGIFGAIIAARPAKTCPDPTYKLWGGNGTLENGGFCCEPGSNGFYQGKMEGVGCTATGVKTLPESEYFASTVPTVVCVMPASTSSPSTPTGSTLTTTTTAPPAANSSFPPSSSSALSGGTIAGIAVGAVGVVGLVAGLLLLYQRRWKRNNNRHNGDHTVTGAAVGSGKPGMMKQHEGGPDSIHSDAAGELSPPHHEQQKDAYELSGVRSPTELPSEQMRHEMANGMVPGAYHEMG